MTMLGGDLPCEMTLSQEHARCKCKQYGGGQTRQLDDDRATNLPTVAAQCGHAAAQFHQHSLIEGLCQKYCPSLLQALNHPFLTGVTRHGACAPNPRSPLNGPAVIDASLLQLAHRKAWGQQNGGMLLYLPASMVDARTTLRAKMCNIG